MRNSVRASIASLLCAASLGGGLVVSGCSSDGSPPPPGRLYFPTTVGLSPDFDADGASDFLVVANSNFDLRYRAGSLQTYDLDVLDERLEEHCSMLPPDDRENCGIIPVQDNRDDLGDSITPVVDLLVAEALIGSYVSGQAIAPSAAGARIYLPVRSDENLTYVDLSPDGSLFCGDPDPSNDFDDSGRHECTDAFREAEPSDQDVATPPDPVALMVAPRSQKIPGAEGNYIVMAHRGGRMSLLWETAEGARPQVVDVLDGFPVAMSDVAMDPVTQLLWEATIFDPVIPRVGVALGETQEDSFLFRSSDAVVAGTVDTATDGADTREIRFDPRPDVRRAYVLSRQPRAVLVVDVDQSVGSLAVRDQIPVGFGPSRIAVTEFEDGRVLAFVTCFDSRDLYVIDVDAGLQVGIVRNLGGPYELAVDVPRRLVYVGDFRSSVLRVLDLEPMFDCLDDTDFTASGDGECSPVPLGFVGRPRAVQELI